MHTRQYAMVTKVTRRALPGLLDRLKLFYPQSFQIQGALNAIKQCKTDCSNIWVDRWPEVNAVLISPSTGRPAGGEVPVLKHERKLFAVNVESARQVLEQNGLFGVDNRIDFRATRETLWGVLADIASSEGYRTTIKGETVWVYYLPRETSIQEQPKISSGFAVRRLFPEDAAILNSVWNSSQGRTTEVYIRGLIQNFPSVAIYEKISGNLVAWDICYEDGSMGQLYVHPSYRRRGLGNVVILHQANQLRSMGKIPHMAISSKNRLSLDIHQKLGFVAIKDERYAWLTCTKANRAADERFSESREKLFGELHTTRDILSL